MIPPVETLKKDTLGATYEHINRLIKDKNFDAKEFIKYNENLNVFEKKVQAIFIDTFKIKEGVINCLLSNDAHLVRRVLKCDWFFEDAVSPKCYEEDIFPNVSFSTRCKIINRLARNIKSEQHAEELFHFVNINYGSKYAEMFLAKCSSHFISDYITKCKPSFNHHDSEKNLINICKRFPDIVITFLENEINKNGFRRSTKLMKYLAKNYPLAFLPIFEKFYLELYYFRFGKKSTKVLYSELMKLAEKNPRIILSGKMNMSVIFKCLTYEEQIIFLKLLVRASSNTLNFQDIKSWSFALSNMTDLLELKKPNERVCLVETVFFQLYNEKYLDHPEVWSLGFLEVFPSDYRAHLVEVLKKKNGDKTVNDMLRSQCMDHERDTQDIFIYLLSCKNAFPLLTQLMTQMTTIERREILLKEMIRNCIINRDPEGLETVVRYISIRHKNDDPRMIYHLISHHVMNSPDIINLNVWDLLEKMVTLLSVNLNDRDIYWKVLESYIAFKLKNNLDARSQIKNMVKLNFIPSANGLVLVRRMKKSYSKTLLMLYYDEIFSGDSEYAVEQIQEKLSLSLLLSVNEYNESVRRTRIKIEDLPLLVESLDKMIKKMDDWKDKYLLTSAVLKNAFLKNKYANILLEFSMEPKTLQYLLKFHPDFIVNSLDKIINYVFELNENEKFEKFFTSRCQIDFLEWMPKLEKVIGEKFKTSVSSSVKVNALRSYSHIANLENFTELVKEYIPNEERLHFENSKADFFGIQMNVAGIIRNVKPVSKNLELVLKYLNKDFLRWVLPSFFSVCHNSSANIIIPILRHLFPKKDVSVRRVILCCILDLSSKIEKCKYCQLVWENEEHASLRGFIFQYITKALKKDPSNEIFEMVKKCITECDEITITRRLSMNMIPLQFLNEYSSVLWEFTEKYESRRFTLNCRQEIIDHFNAKNISALSEEFCEKVLRRYLFVFNSEIKAEDFCCHYVLHHSQTMDQKLSLILELLRERRTSYRSVVYFINQLKCRARSDPEPFFVIFEALLKEWPKMYSFCNMFPEYLFLNYMKGYRTALIISDSKKNELFGAALGKEIRKIVNADPMYNNCIEIFNATLYDFISNFNLHDILDTVTNNFLGSSFGQVEGIIAINLIPDEVFDSFKNIVLDQEYNSPYDVGIREKYSEIFKKLIYKNDDILKMYMNVRTINGLDFLCVNLYRRIKYA